MAKKQTKQEFIEKYREIIDLYNSGKGYVIISSETGKSRGSIREIISRAKSFNLINQFLIKKEILTKEKLKFIDETKLQNQEIKEKIRTEIIVEAVKEAIKPVQFIMPSFNITTNKGKEEEQACLLISDVHVGKVTKTYNSDVFKKRLDHLIKSVCKITDLLRHGYKINTLNIFFAGDIVDGEGIYPTQSLHVDQGVLKQVFRIGLPEFTKQLILLSKFFKNINVFCIRGNHGRSGRFAEESSNWDIVFYEALKLATANYKNINWNVSYDWNLRLKIYNWVFELIHGHQIKMYLNVPYYGITMKGSRWQGSHGHYDYLLLGHFHNAAMSQFNDWEFFLNGSFSSSDDFADEVLGLLGSTEQLFFGVHHRKKVTWRYKIKLD